MVLCAVNDRPQYVEIALSGLFGYFTENHVVASITQMFYSYRIAIFTRSKYAAAVTVMVRDNLLSAVLFCLMARYTFIPAVCFAARICDRNGNANKIGKIYSRHIEDRDVFDQNWRMMSFIHKSMFISSSSIFFTF